MIPAWMKKQRTRRQIGPGPARLLILCAFEILALAFTSCQRHSNAQRFDLKGKVVSVDRELKRVTIAHEEIPGYMAAMTMPFALKEEWAYGVLGPGDQIKAMLVVDADRSWLEDIVITEEGTVDPTGVTDITHEPTTGEEVPDFKLTNQEGQRIALRQFRGKGLVLTFIYTRCPLPDYCPLMSSHFEELQAALQQKPALMARTDLLSISFDPEYDTPQVLKNYGGSYTQRFDHWQFASGSPDEIKSIAQYFGLRYWAESDQIVHSLRTAVIGPDGKLVKLYRGNEWKVAEILSDLEKLKLA